MTDITYPDKPIKFKVKGHLRDLLKFKNLVKNRKHTIDTASANPTIHLPINELAEQLHPLEQQLQITEIREETPTTKTFKLIPDVSAGTNHCAYFRAGQYLSVTFNIDGATITRPYSIASSPFDALNGYYELTIKKIVDGFVTDYIWNNWKVNSKIKASTPLGYFYYNPIRDSSSLVAVAGGSGISPFRSMLREIISKDLPLSLNLLYGCSDDKDIIYYDEFNQFATAHPEKFRLTYVLSCDETHMEGCEQGFITADLIKKYSKPLQDSYFLCGPGLMYDFVEAELKTLNIPLKRIRKEAYGEIRDVSRFKSYPSEKPADQVSIRITNKGKVMEIPALTSESLLIALEKAHLAIPSACRSGECQFCRTRLLSGDVWVSPHSDGRRTADKKFGYIHPCVSFPLTDLEIELPIK